MSARFTRDSVFLAALLASIAYPIPASAVSFSFAGAWSVMDADGPDGFSEDLALTTGLLEAWEPSPDALFGVSPNIPGPHFKVLLPPSFALDPVLPITPNTINFAPVLYAGGLQVYDPTETTLLMTGDLDFLTATETFLTDGTIGGINTEFNFNLKNIVVTLAGSVSPILSQFAVNPAGGILNVSVQQVTFADLYLAITTGESISDVTYSGSLASQRPVPEPGTAALLTLAAGALGLRRRGLTAPRRWLEWKRSSTGGDR